MKITQAFSHLLKKKDDGKEYFFSLYVDIDAAAVAVWSMDYKKTPTIASFAHGVVVENSWEARTQVIDRLLSAAEEKVGSSHTITKTVYGLPGAYLTPESNISDSAGPELKKLAQMLELKPVGFVPLFQALANQLKIEEGVPPSIILIGCSLENAHLTLFRVGKLTCNDAVTLGDDPSVVVEALLKKHQDRDVLPSRMLLYGGNSTKLEEIRAKLLKHPWPTRTNFLHFPKIEIIPIESLLTAVSIAGASELASDVSRVDESSEVTTAVAQPRPSVIPTTPSELMTEDVAMEEVEEEAETIGDAIEKDEETNENIANVEMVTPESLGFQKSDVLEKPQGIKAVDRDELEEVFTQEDDVEEEVKPKKKFTLPFVLPKIPKDTFTKVSKIFSGIRMPKSGALPIVGGIIGIILLLISLFYFVPSVTVTVLLSQQSVDESQVLTVNPTATVADSASKIIPGHTQTKSISGEKTIAVTGKKSIGDPAKGAVVIYNKVTSAKTLPKGTILSANGLSFTLDSDVSIASASEAIGSITFGKVTANVTAKEIGPNGNLPIGKEFVFNGVSASQVSARNDVAFTGGTSKQVTVVSRADQDGLIKALTDDLVGQAKTQLAATATGGERLIDQTIKTTVSDKTFDQEVDQQAGQLHGKITITVTGISVSDEDVKALLTTLVENKIPKGYALAADQTQVTVGNVSVKKDGTITLTAKLAAIVLPTIDTAALKTQLVGKDVTVASALLKQTNGVAGAEYRFTLSPTSSRLPMNPNNITITTMVQR